jgi:hypothetical protein
MEPELIPAEMGRVMKIFGGEISAMKNRQYIHIMR